MKKGMLLALSLTLSRVILGPLFVILTVYQKKLQISDVNLFLFMISILIYSELSDIFDGIVARKTNQVTDLGKILDPMADSVFRLSVFFSFTLSVVKLPIILVLLLFYRDTLVAAIRNLCAINGYALAARKSGKLKAIIQAITSFIIVICFGFYSYGRMDLELMQMIAKWSLGLCAAYALASGVEYYIANKKYIKKSVKI